MSANIRHSSESVEHYTPTAIVTAAHSVLGGIDIDPASCAFANKIVQAKKFYSLSDPGHDKPWRGTVFLNPPGGRVDSSWVSVKAGGESSAKKWWFKLMREWVTGHTTAAIFVGFSLELLQTSQVNPEESLPIPLDFPLCFPSRRVAYDNEVDGERQRGASPPHASFLALVTSDAKMIEDFRLQFRTFGRVIVPRGGHP